MRSFFIYKTTKGKLRKAKLGELAHERTTRVDANDYEQALWLLVHKVPSLFVSSGKTRHIQYHLGVDAGYIKDGETHTRVTANNTEEIAANDIVYPLTMPVCNISDAINVVRLFLKRQVEKDKRASRPINTTLPEARLAINNGFTKETLMALGKAASHNPRKVAMILNQINRFSLELSEIIGEYIAVSHDKSTVAINPTDGGKVYYIDESGSELIDLLR